jgi:hypothetical protein
MKQVSEAENRTFRISFLSKVPLIRHLPKGMKIFPQKYSIRETSCPSDFSSILMSVLLLEHPPVHTHIDHELYWKPSQVVRHEFQLRKADAQESRITSQIQEPLPPVKLSPNKFHSARAVPAVFSVKISMPA